MSDYRKPIPVASIESKPYWEGLRQHRLMTPRCESCGRHWFPPSRLCPHCGSDRSAWADVSGRGKVYSFVIYHRVYHPGFADETPYVVAVIELDEGPRMISNVTGVAPDAVVCNMTVQVSFEDITETATIPKFRPAPH